jgi:hypothetical protein
LPINLNDQKDPMQMNWALVSLSTFVSWGVFVCVWPTFLEISCGTNVVDIIYKIPVYFCGIVGQKMVHCHSLKRKMYITIVFCSRAVLVTIGYL